MKSWIAVASVLVLAHVEVQPAAAQQPPRVPDQQVAGATPGTAPLNAFLEVLAIQVALDRAGFSPGVIDGAMGSNTQRAIQAYEQQHGAAPEPAAQPLARYTIAEQDVSGPFVQTIPPDLMKQAELPALAYTSPFEALAERFHTEPELLQRLNPAATFAAGERILVPDVSPFSVPARRDVVGTSGKNGSKQNGEPTVMQEQVPPLPRPDVVVTVSKSARALHVRDANGKVIFYAPVTTGSEHDPLPVGEWKVTSVHYSPPFNYNPELFWDADPSHAKARIQPGPNNPVGAVWIDLSKEHYGIHGAPEPASVGKTASHGCVRLTNWDVTALASLVGPGTRVVFAQ